MKQICRNSAYSIRKGKVTGLQRELQKILKMRKPGDIKTNIKVDTKVKQLMTSKTQKLKTDVDFLKEPNVGVSSDVSKEKLQSYSEKPELPKIKMPKSNGQKGKTDNGIIVKKIQRNGSSSPFLCMSIFHRCYYKRSVQYFERNKKNDSSNPINVFSFDECLYIYKTCHKKIVKAKIPFHSVSNKPEVYNFVHIFMEFRNLKKCCLQKGFYLKRLLSCHVGKWKEFLVQFVTFQSILLMLQMCYHNLLTAMG